MNEYRQQQLRAHDSYRYHGITYTYADLIAAHQKQQQTAWKHIECGDYETAHSITSTDTREFLPQIYGSPEQSEPEPIEQNEPKRKSKLLRILCRLLK